MSDKPGWAYYPGRHLREWRLVVRQFGPKWWEFKVLRPGQQWDGGSYGERTGHKSRKAAIRAGRKELARYQEVARIEKANPRWEIVQ